jgi:hypothetical protein
MSLILAAVDNCIDCDDVAKVLWIPIAGPIAADSVDTTDDDAFTALMVLWSLAEAAGATMLIWGLIKGRSKPQPQVGQIEEGWRFGPLFGQANGIGLTRHW